MLQISSDLLAQYQEVLALCETLTDSQWHTATAFHGWTPWDQVAHLCFFDETGLLAVRDAPAFRADADAINAGTEAGEEISAQARHRYGHLDGPALLAHWRPRYQALAAALAALEPRARLPWYGPDMSARSFATARLMETWAHSQDIYDLLGLKRNNGGHIRHIAHLGVSTFGWTFINRGLTPPEPKPYVALQGPDGELWEWGEPSDTDYVLGDATDFCLLVTQRRHRDDTGLRYGGSAAQHWLAMAQCFAGEPATPPAPGERAG